MLTCVSAAAKTNKPSAAIVAAEVSSGRFDAGASKSLQCFPIRNAMLIPEAMRLTMGGRRSLGGERERLSPFFVRFPSIEFELSCYTLEIIHEISLRVPVSG